MFGLVDVVRLGAVASQLESYEVSLDRRRFMLVCMHVKESGGF